MVSAVQSFPKIALALGRAAFLLLEGLRNRAYSFKDDGGGMSRSRRNMFSLLLSNLEGPVVLSVALPGLYLAIRLLKERHPWCCFVVGYQLCELDWVLGQADAARDC